MKSIEDNIETLSRAIESEARGEADKLMSEAHARADEIRKRGQEEAEAERTRILDRARQEVERVRSQAIANARLKARSVQYAHREKLLERVFHSASDQITGIQAWSNYEEVAVRLLKEAVQQIDSPRVKVRMDAKTAQKLTPDVLRKIGAELKVELEVGQPLEKGTGVVVESDSGRMVFDNTLEFRLSRLQNSLRSPVFHLLSGEKL